MADFADRYAGIAFQLALITEGVKDPDAAKAQPAAFGFHWFIPELMKHKRVWRDVVLASLVIQLLALGTPLFTQVIIDKVVVHRTESTLIVIAIGLGVFMVFSSLLSWVRQYLILHTGNRVDAVLGAAVFRHLFRLPPRVNADLKLTHFRFVRRFKTDTPPLQTLGDGGASWRVGRRPNRKDVPPSRRSRCCYFLDLNHPGLTLMFESVTFAGNRHDARVVQQAIQQRCGQRGILGKGRIPLTEGQITGHDQTAFFIAGRNDLKEQIGLLPGHG